MILDIHLEKCDDNGEKLEKILNLGKPVIISLVPVLMLPHHEVFKKGIYPSDYFYPQKFIDLLKQLVNDSNLYLGQQGFAHYCTNCFSKKEERDPWHENMCLYSDTLSVDEQKKFMERGKKVIEESLGVSPFLYVPPNHQYNENTQQAIKELNFRYMVIRNKLGIYPFRKNGLIILPENDLDENGEIVYIHYDEMGDNFDAYLDIIRKSSHLKEINVKRQLSRRTSENYREIIKVKRKRDLDNK